MSRLTNTTKHVHRAVSLVTLLVALAMTNSSCGPSDNSGEVRAPKTVAASETLATDAQLARKPAILRISQSLDDDLPRLLERVPSEVRRPLAQIRQIPNSNSSRRYWLTPWQGPKGDFGFACLYAISPGEQGIATSCYSDDQLRSGRAVSLAFIDGRFEFIGFNPDPRGSVSLNFADRKVSVPIRNGVFVGSSREFPRSIRVVNAGRSFVHPVPNELKNSSG